MFRRREESAPSPSQPAQTERITSVLGSGITLRGVMSGAGGVRIEGAFDGDIHLRGLLVVGETGRITCEHLRANVVIVAGAVRGDITAEKLEIRSTGRVWGNVTTAAFATEEGAFLRGQITMEERVEIQEPAPEEAEEPAPQTSPEAEAESGLEVEATGDSAPDGSAEQQDEAALP